MLRKLPRSIKDSISVRMAASGSLPAQTRMKISRKIGENAFELADCATLQRVTEFANPVSGDRLVQIEFDELTEPITVKSRIELDNKRGTIKAQAVDGRVQVEWDNDSEGPEWVDLATLDFQWV